MQRSQWVTLITTTIIFSFLGGALSSLLLEGPLARADQKDDGKVLIVDALEARSLTIKDETGATVVQISSKTEGRPLVQLYGKERKLLAAIGIGGDQYPCLLFFDEHGNCRFHTCLDDGFPNMRFYDQFKKIEHSLPILPQNRKQGRKWPD